MTPAPKDTEDRVRQAAHDDANAGVSQPDERIDETLPPSLEDDDHVEDLDAIRDLQADHGVADKRAKIDALDVSLARLPSALLFGGLGVVGLVADVVVWLALLKHIGLPPQVRVLTAGAFAVTCTGLAAEGLQRRTSGLPESPADRRRRVWALVALGGVAVLGFAVRVAAMPRDSGAVGYVIAAFFAAMSPLVAVGAGLSFAVAWPSVARVRERWVLTWQVSRDEAKQRRALARVHRHVVEGQTIERERRRLRAVYAAEHTVVSAALRQQNNKVRSTDDTEGL